MQNYNLTWFHESVWSGGVLALAQPKSHGLEWSSVLQRGETPQPTAPCACRAGAYQVIILHIPLTGIRLTAFPNPIGCITTPKV